ncbi:MAG: PQQ-binding-like beta-propeller repeat protein [Bacteroidales bacterium]
MKIRTKIILVILAVVLLAGLYMAYMVYTITMGSEDLSGVQGKIPEAASQLPEITSGNDDWTQWRGSNADGRSLTTGIRTDWDPEPEKVWSIDYLCQDKSTASWSSMAVRGNRLIVPGRNEKMDILFCLEATTGELLWQNSYEAETNTSHGPGPRATPAIDGDRVYSLGRNGDLVCWSLYDGKMIWKKNAKADGGAEPQWGYSSSPVISGDLVFIQGGGSARVAAYNKLNGELVWKSMSGDAGYAAPVITTLGNDTLLMVFHATGLSCLDATDGKELWAVPWETDYGVNATTPTVDSNRIFITSGYGRGCELLEFSREGAKVLWKNAAMASQHSDPVLLDGYIYGYTGESSGRDGKFTCIELATGNEKWNTAKMGWGTCLWVDGHLLCLDIKGNLYLVKPDPAKFNLVAEFPSAISGVTHPAWTAPVVANGYLYLRYLQQLVCYKLK